MTFPWRGKAWDPKPRHVILDSVAKHLLWSDKSVAGISLISCPFTLQPNVRISGHVAGQLKSQDQRLIDARWSELEKVFVKWSKFNGLLILAGREQ